MRDVILNTLREAVTITVLVAAMMALVELVNHMLRHRLHNAARKNNLSEILLGSVLGVLPGCMGGYICVSLYTEGAVSFSSLLSMMVATTGDEAFVMLASYPGTAVAIFASLFVMAIAFGVISQRLSKNSEQAHLLHDDADCSDIKHHLSHIPLHALKIFLWTFGLMLAIGLLQMHIDVESWIKGNGIAMVVLAVLIGIIPQSGPHMAFVTLFAQGVLPLPVLLANCLMQDGHAGLPLMAKSPRAFFKVKLIKAVPALLIGIAGLLI